MMIEPATPFLCIKNAELAVIKHCGDPSHSGDKDSFKSEVAILQKAPESKSALTLVRRRSTLERNSIFTLRQQGYPLPPDKIVRKFLTKKPCKLLKHFAYRRDESAQSLLHRATTKTT